MELCQVPLDQLSRIGWIFFFLSIFEIEIGYVATLAQHISLSPRQPNEISPADGLRRFGQCGYRGRHRRWRSRTRPAPPFNLLSR